MIMQLRRETLALPLLGEIQLGGERPQAVVGLRQLLRAFLHQLFQLPRERP